MLNPDSLPVWLAAPLIAVLWIWFVVSIFRASADPRPEYTRLDKEDGLGSHLDVTG